jgi:hypothetical protein
MSQVREEHVKNKCHLKEVPDPFMSLPVVPVENAKPKPRQFNSLALLLQHILETMNVCVCKKQMMKRLHWLTDQKERNVKYYDNESLQE